MKAQAKVKELIQSLPDPQFILDQYLNLYAERSRLEKQLMALKPLVEKVLEAKPDQVVELDIARIKLFQVIGCEYVSNLEGLKEIIDNRILKRFISKKTDYTQIRVTWKGVMAGNPEGSKLS